MHPPRIFNAVFEPVTIRLDGPDPNRVLQVGFEFFANIAVILGDVYLLADLEARLCHEASRVERSNFITTQDSIRETAGGWSLGECKPDGHDLALGFTLGQPWPSGFALLVAHGFPVAQALPAVS